MENLKDTVGPGATHAMIGFGSFGQPNMESWVDNQCQVASLILIGRDVVPRRIDPVGVRFAQLHLDLNHNGFALMEFFTKSAALVMSHGCWFEIGFMKMIIVLPKQSKKLNFVRYEKPTAQN